jgi:mitochondrial fission protein ELM1
MQHSLFTAINISGDCLPGPQMHSRAYDQVFCERHDTRNFDADLAILLVLGVSGMLASAVLAAAILALAVATASDVQPDNGLYSGQNSTGEFA